MTISLSLTVRDLDITDLADLDWSGGPQHVSAVADAVAASADGEVAVLAICLPNGRLVACGGVDFRLQRDAGQLWMLSVHQRLRSSGLGTELIGALEARTLAAGRSVSRVTAELDNPPAARLYRRLGYVATGSVLESWPLSRDTTYVTGCTVFERRLIG